MKEHTEASAKFYRSRKWLECREGFISYRRSLDGGLCQRCSRKYGYIVHHKIHIDSMNINNPDITLNWVNLEYLCQDCHNKEHFGEPKRVVGFDEDGQPRVIPPDADF